MLPSLQYVIRAGSSFHPAPHAVVAGMFGKAPQPMVFPSMNVEPATFDRGLKVVVEIVLVNDGSTVAEDLFVSASVHRAANAAMLP